MLQDYIIEGSILTNRGYDQCSCSGRGGWCMPVHQSNTPRSAAKVCAFVTWDVCWDLCWLKLGLGLYWETDPKVGFFQRDPEGGKPLLIKTKHFMRHLKEHRDLTVAFLAQRRKISSCSLELNKNHIKAVILDTSFWEWVPLSTVDFWV